MKTRCSPACCGGHVRMVSYNWRSTRNELTGEAIQAVSASGTPVTAGFVFALPTAPS
ncbi:hypothetical protein [Streptomyces piniterrae]|uniref:hypothetical protein n=1 Tax=Streptomyces piniterrae TaxID=2571125 RepID=UPI00145F078C|nr:hypothetical protein [Streptomyces piniterrae]